MRNRVRALVAATFLVGGTLVAGPINTAVAGDSTCAYDPNTKRVTVGVNPANNQVVVMRSGNQIQLLGPTDCGNATRFNTNKVVVNDPVGHNVQAFVDLVGGPFKPGVKNEPGKSDEIEFDFDLSDGVNSFIVSGSPAGDYLTAGKPPLNYTEVPTKFNLNANEGTGIDADVSVEGTVNDVSLDGLDGADTLRAQGGTGTGGPLTGLVYLEGGNHNDTIRGGNGPDLIHGDFGADSLKGMGSGDELYGDAGNDGLNGGPGSDLCDGGPGTNTKQNCEIEP